MKCQREQTENNETTGGINPNKKSQQASKTRQSRRGGRSACLWDSDSLHSASILRSIVKKSGDLCRKCVNALQCFDIFYVPLLSKLEKLLIGEPVKEV